MKQQVKQVAKFLWGYNHVLILAYYGVLAWAYAHFNATTVPKYIMYSRLDDYIPFVKLFVIPYLLWYVYIAASLTFFGLKSRADFIKLALYMFIGMSICYVIYYLFPNGQNLRPTLTGDDICTRMIRWLYSTDTPYDVAPSMHVLDCIAIHAVIAKSKILRGKKWVQYTSLVSAVLISLSTVFIKQHSIVDVFYAAILGAVLYLVLYRPWRNEEDSPRFRRLKGLFKKEPLPSRG